MAIEYREIMWAEMKPDIYSGDNCDEHRPQWYAYAEGDMDGDYIETIDISSKHYPPGTKITVRVPCCPQCHQDYEMCESDEGCDFNWLEWTESRYS